MAILFYSMAGEGRGHATRVKAIVDDLCTRHRVVLFAPGHAYDLLEPIYRGSSVEVRPLDGFAFSYTASGVLDYTQTIRDTLAKLRALPAQVTRLCTDFRNDRPDLIITDFDPVLPRVAQKLSIPYISIDHQHFLTSYSLRGLPWRQRFHGWCMGLVVGAFYRRQKMTVVSSFYRPPLRLGTSKSVRQVGVLLGQDVLQEKSRDEGFLAVYLRRNTPQRVFRALANCGVPVRIYGTERVGIDGNLTFLPIDRASFVADLARCTALVSTAGNQVVGEALFLQKPVLVMPETGNWEQGINGFFVEQMGVGKCVSMRTLRSGTIRQFLAQREQYRNAIDAQQASGNRDVAELIEAVLQDVRPMGPVARIWRQIQGINTRQQPIPQDVS